jgi:phytoene/squalene synthetase
LSLLTTDGLVEIRCLVGHTYSVTEVFRAHSEAQEKALWSAVVALRETATLVDSLSDRFPSDVLEKLRAQVSLKQQQAAAVQHVIEQLEPFVV